MRHDTVPTSPDLEPSFRLAEYADLPELVEVSRDFFNESEMSDFATFDPEAIRKVLEVTIESDAMEGVLFTVGGRIEGFLSFMIDRSYTVEPVALGHLFFVRKKYRRSPAGRIMIEMAEGIAEDRGCVAMYQGVMANIPGSNQSMANMFTKRGYEPMFWGRKILKETPA